MKLEPFKDDWIPWYTATENIWYMRRMLDNDENEIYEDFRVSLRVLILISELRKIILGIFAQNSRKSL